MFKRIISVLLISILLGSMFLVSNVSAATHTYTVAGDEVLCGTKWDENNSDNDMQMDGDGTYKKTYKNVPAGVYELKVVEDNSWGVNFSRKDSVKYENVKFEVKENYSTVFVKLTITGTTILGYTEGYVDVYVNGVLAEEPPAPEVEERYLTGSAGLCNGIEWDPKAEINKMIYNSDGSYSITVSNIPAGNYEFKITSNGTWEPAFGYYGLISPGSANQKITIDEDNSTVTFILGANNIVESKINEIPKEPFSWKYDKDTYTLTISGEDDIPDYDQRKTPWASEGSIKHIIIEEGITRIGDNAFYCNEDLEDVVFPSTLKNIGSSAFYKCSNLKSIDFKGNLEKIDKYAFEYCSSLKEINFPDEVDSIGQWCFAFCTSLEIFTMPKKLISSSGQLFLGDCSSLKEIRVPEGANTQVVDGALLYNNGKTLVFYPPARINTTFTVPETVTKISKGAFYRNQNLKTITILDNVSEFKQSVFCEAASLTNIVVSETNPYFSSAQGVIFNKDKTKLIHYPSAKTNTSYDVPDTVVEIADDSFINSVNLEEVILHTGLETIGICAFEACDNLKSIVIPETVETIGAYGLGYGKDSLGYPKVEGFTIYGAYGSYAETYAETKGFNFEETYIEKLTQKITGPKTSYTKTYGDKSFSIAAKTSGDGDIEYYTSNSSIATVSNNGTVSIKKSGKVYLYVFASETRKYDESWYDIELNVKTKSQKLTGLSSTYKKTYGTKPFNLGAKATSKLTYKTNNKKVAIVDSKGKVTLKGYGTAKITVASVNDGKYSKVSKTVVINVIPKKPGKIQVYKYKKKKKYRDFYWKNDSKLTGYQFQWSKYSSFKTKESYNFKSNYCGTGFYFPKNGYYYVRLRSYKKVSGKNCYSDWKTIQIKV